MRDLCGTVPQYIGSKFEDSIKDKEIVAECRAASIVSHLATGYASMESGRVMLAECRNMPGQVVLWQNQTQAGPDVGSGR